MDGRADVWQSHGHPHGSRPALPRRRKVQHFIPLSLPTLLMEEESMPIIKLKMGVACVL